MRSVVNSNPGKDIKIIASVKNLCYNFFTNKERRLNMGPVSAIKKGFVITGKSWALVIVLFLLNFFSGVIGI